MFFSFNSMEDNLEMGLFVGRYISTMFIFVLGLKAPGIVQNSYENINTNNINSEQSMFSSTVI